MEDKLISLETAKLAKELGFDIPTYFSFIQNYNAGPEYISVDELESQFGNITKAENHNQDGNWILKRISRPTQSLLKKWLREVHNIHVSSHPTFINKKWYPKAVNLDNTNDDLFAGRIFNYHRDTYEEALEFGLSEILKYLLQKETQKERTKEK